MSPWGGMEFMCHICSEKSRVFCCEWPPKMTVCPSCSGICVLIAYDPYTKRSTYALLPPTF